MKKQIVLILALISFAFFFNTAFAQLPFGIKLKDKNEKLASQKEKSPAAGQIKLLEKDISGVNSTLGDPRWEPRREERNQKSYDDVALSIKKLDETLAAIKEKDAKVVENAEWTSDISKIKTKYDGMLSAYTTYSKERGAYNYVHDKAGYVYNMTDNKYSLLYKYDKFSEYMFTKFNYADTKKKLEEVIVADPKLKENGEYKTIKKFFDSDFPEFAEKKLPTEIEALRKDATEHFERGPAASIEKINNSIGFCKAMIQLMPELANYKTTLAQLEEINVKFDKYLNEKVYSSEMHKKNVGKLLLCNKPIVPGQEKEEDFKKTYLPGESIYGVRYYGSGVAPSEKYQLFINGNLEIEGYFKEGKVADETDVKVTAFVFPVIPDFAYEKKKLKKGANDYECFKITDRIFSKLKNAGEFADKVFKVKLTIGYVGSTVAEFTLDASAGYANLQKLYNDLKQQRVNDIRVSKSKTINAEIAAAATSALTGDGHTVIKITYTEDAWRFGKNKYTSVVTSRFAAVDAVVKDKSGKCFIYSAEIKQQKGGAVYGKAYISEILKEFKNADGNYYESYLDGKDGIDGNSEGFEINCLNINK